MLRLNYGGFMKILYDNTNYDVYLEDDGTLDTIISVNGKWFRFNGEDGRDNDGEINDYVMYQAIEAYLDDIEMGMI